MKKFVRSILLILWVSMIILFLGSCESKKDGPGKIIENKETIKQILEEGKYYSKDDVVEYIIKYNKLPSNYIRKSEAKRLGWNPRDGNLWEIADGFVIGGDIFGNREKTLPKLEDEKYYEADVNFKGGRRNSERVVFTKSGKIYYTSDHYRTFEKIR